MRTCKITIEGVSPYSASKVFETTEKLKGEGFDAFEERCWRERLNVDSKGVGFIPAQAFIGAIHVAAKRFAGKIKGKGNATWSKFFEAGLLCITPLSLGITRSDVLGERLFVPSDGMKGGGKRVFKTFPVIHKWGGTIAIHVLDDEIPADVFEETVRKAFSLVGVGRWRPERGGQYGRAEVKSFEWSEE